MNLTENARKWLAFGEKGISSEVMFGAISGLQKKNIIKSLNVIWRNSNTGGGIKEKLK